MLPDLYYLLFLAWVCPHWATGTFLSMYSLKKIIEPLLDPTLMYVSIVRISTYSWQSRRVSLMKHCGNLAFFQHIHV